MPPRGEIESKKILTKEVFKKWFRIPVYQRPYVWGYEEINDLLDDLSYALNERPDNEYFLGSFVFQVKHAAPELGRQFDENDLLDGQQRLTTLLLLIAVIRDLVADTRVKKKCQEYIFQEADTIENIPERLRLVFGTREKVNEFIEQYIKAEGGTDDEAALTRITQKTEDISVKNIAAAVLEIRKFFQKNPHIKPDSLLPFLANKVLMIYVASEDLEDAFRLFTILNDRGIPLRNSDILKSLNLGALNPDTEQIKYAKLWEEAEGELGDEFDRFLNHIRTILVKERPRLSLLREFEDKIYDPKEKDKTTGQQKPILLKKGKETFALIEKYLSVYKTMLGGQNYDDIGNFKFDNLIKVMWVGLPATDWMPPLLRYFDKFGYTRLMEFLHKLDNKFSADWIGQKTPSDRIEAMNNVIKVIDAAANADDVLNSACFDFDRDAFLRVIDGPVYGRRFTKYIMLKLDYYYQNHDQKMHFETLSVEHILPQTPADGSKWLQDFAPAEREEMTHKLGNLVLITCGKNGAQGRKDFADKVSSYFLKNIDTCPNSLRVLKTYAQWTPAELQGNHATVIQKTREHYGIP